MSMVFAVAAISVAFAGYAAVLVPSLGASRGGQAALAAVIIWMLTAVNLRGVAEAASLQLVTTLLKIVPLLIIVALGLFSGSTDNLPVFNAQALSVGGAMATTALLTMWAFIGVEAAVIPAQDVVDAQRTIPRAVVAASLTVAALYIASTAAVMTLVPADVLSVSSAPFADAAQALGRFGGPMIAIGALISTAGSLNGNILLSGQMPLAVARDGLVPGFFARRNGRAAPASALVVSSVLATALLAFNYTEGLLQAFTFLISISTLAVLMPYAVSALAELRVSWRRARGWAVLSVVALAYTVIAIAGAGPKTLFLGLVLLIAGLPVYLWSRRTAGVGR